MTGRAKHAERSHKTHHKNDEVSKRFYYSNAVKKVGAENIKKRASLFEKIMGLMQKGDR